MNDARFYRASLVAAPALLLASSLSLSALHNDSAARLRAIADQPGRYYLFCLLGVLGALALLPACVGLAQALRPHRARLAVAAAALTVTGAAFALVDYGTELVKWQAGRTGTDSAAMTALLDRVETSPGINAILQVSGLAFLAGFVVLGVGLRRARLVPLWVAIVMPAALFLNLFGFASGSIAVLDASGVVLLVAMAAAGRALSPTPTPVHPSAVPAVA
jgi:hypothetical protein